MQTYVNIHTGASAKQLTFLIDTGADISILKETKLYPETLYYTNTSVSISGVTSGSVDSIGKTDVNLFPNTINQIAHDFHIVDESFPIPTDGILGIDFIRRFNCRLDFSKNELELNPSDFSFTIPLLDSGTEKFLIPARCELVRQLDIDINADSVIEHKEIAPGVFIAGAIISKTSKFIRLLNTTSETIELDLKIDIKPLTDFIIKKQPTTTIRKCATTASSNDDEAKRQENLRSRLNVPDHVSSNTRTKFFELCKKYADVFHLNDDKLSTNNFYEQRINPLGDEPVYVKNYRMPHASKAEILSQIQQMLENDIIEPSDSPYNSPILLVPKKSPDGKKKWRLVVDFRQLNKKIQPDKFPLPRIDDILDQLGRAKYFSTLDLMSGFHQISLDEKSRKFTAFSSDRGHYHFKRLPFGINIAPNSFQRMMNIALSGLPPDVCFLYIDDIIVTGCSEKHHLANLELVFEQLRLRNLKLNPDKCNFFKGEVTFLGHTVTDKGILPNKSVSSIIDAYPVPKDAKGVNRFTSFASFYRRFINNYATLVKPMKALEKKGVPFIWNEACQDAFDTVRYVLKNPPILQYPDFEKEFILTTDASKLGCGAVLQQEHEGTLLPVAYASRGFTKGESNKSTIEQELTAIHWAVTHFRAYLYGRKFLIQTDHKPLVYLYSLKDPSSKLTRMRLDLEEFNFDIQYVKGKDNVIADALSRIDYDDIKNVRMYICKVTTRAQSKKENVPEKENESLNTQKIFPQVFECLSVEEVTKLPHLHTSKNESLIKFEIKIGKTRKYVKEYKYDTPNNEYHALEHGFKEVLVQMKTGKSMALSLDDSLLKVLGKEKLKGLIKSRDEKLQLILYKPRIHVETTVDVQTILREHHDSPTAGHPGQNRMYKKLRRSFVWKNMKKTIREYIKKCEMCKKNKTTRHTREAMLETTTPDQPMQVVAIDTVGPLSQTENDNKYALTAQCELTKYIIAVPMPNKEAKTVARALVEHIILQYGPMIALKSDLGTEFINETMSEVLSILGIEKQNSTAYHPQTIGGLERNHRVLNEFLRSCLANSLYGWDNWLPFYCFAYNTTPNSVTNYTPFELMFGRVASFRNSKSFTELTPLYNLENYAKEMKFRLQMAYERTKTLIQTDKTKRVSKDLNTNFNPIKIVVGDKVKLKIENRNKLDPFYDGPYVIEKIHDRNNVSISKDTKKLIVHKNRLKLW